MATLKFVNINKIYDNNVQAVFDFNLEVQDKEFIVFVGPSGCGKSTTLRMVAGLEEITSGDLYIDDKLVNNLEPKDRDIAMVFQNYALYPHMTVYENMAFSLKLKKIPRDEIARRVEEAANILGLSQYLNRKPKALSGGQRQRVALGRAIVRHPKVFLMDEPLSNLDAKLRVQMRTEIAKIHKKVGATTIYVTHDQTEAMTMATRIVVMNKGYIQQIGTPIEIYNHPANIFVATFIGSPAMNLINAKFVKDEVILPQGTIVKLGKDFEKAVNDFYVKEKANLEQELKQIEDNFIEKKEYEDKIKIVEEKNKNHSTKMLEYELQKLHEELKLCLESNARRTYLINSLEKINALDLKKEISVIFGIRPEDIYQANRILTDEVVSQQFALKVSVAELLGHEYYVHSEFEGVEIVSKIHAKTLVNVGDELNLVFDLSKIHLFDTITQKLIK